MARPLRRRKGFFVRWYGVIKKSIKLFAFTAESQRTQSKAILFVGRRSREFYGRDTDKQKPPSSAGEIFRRRPEAYRESASPDPL
jgi:hypothetical protein